MPAVTAAAKSSMQPQHPAAMRQLCRLDLIPPHLLPPPRQPRALLHGHAAAAAAEPAHAAGQEPLAYLPPCCDVRCRAMATISRMRTGLLTDLLLLMLGFAVLEFLALFFTAVDISTFAVLALCANRSIRFDRALTYVWTRNEGPCRARKTTRVQCLKPAGLHGDFCCRC